MATLYFEGVKLNKTFLIFFLICPLLSYACSVPTSGDKYNSLIKISEIEEELYVDTKSYVISFPTFTAGLKYSNAEVVFYHLKEYRKIIASQKGWGQHEILKSYITTPIALKENGGEMLGIIRASDKSELSFSVNVEWSPESIGLCSIYAKQSLTN